MRQLTEQQQIISALRRDSDEAPDSRTGLFSSVQVRDLLSALCLQSVKLLFLQERIVYQPLDHPTLAGIVVHCTAKIFHTFFPLALSACRSRSIIYSLTGTHFVQHRSFPLENTSVGAYSSQTRHSQSILNTTPPDGSETLPTSDVLPAPDHETTQREVANSHIHSGSVSTGPAGQRDVIDDVAWECPELRGTLCNQQHDTCHSKLLLFNLYLRQIGTRSERAVPIVMLGLAKLPPVV